MRYFVNRPSSPFHEAVQALERLAGEEGLEMAERAFATAVWEKRREAFAKRLGVKPTAGHVCLNRLVKGHCKGTGLMFPKCFWLPVVNVHVSLWLRDGKPHVYVSQPYALTLKDMRALVQFCDRTALTLP
ncbi:hypothetical protein [Thermanaeromonas sp. C210]|uniref:hypothetical protein n=1 Tax=Thermanaeromonas sp. C210 TaxID=2731925 RepID=UPI00155B520E|nr:hypothetical protein [Thermanaeromonas sp. C210]GFN22168.1 hypothetical protein TAMC210_04840 [Thermanaeromonas sp. C210]